MHTIPQGQVGHNIKSAIKVLMALQEEMGVRGKPILESLMDRVTMMLGSYHPVGEEYLEFARKHDMLMSFPRSLIKFFSRYTGVERGSQDNGKGSGPVMEAGDSEMLALCCPYLFHNIATNHVEAYNKKLTRRSDHVKDPSPDICRIFTDHLKWWTRLRRPRLSTRGLKKLRRSGEKCVDTLVSVADFGDDFHNNTKQHAVFHYPYFRGLLGAWTNFNAGVGDMKHKDALKRHEDLTQQHQATHGYSILQGNIRDTTCRLLAQAIDCNVRPVSVPCAFQCPLWCPFRVRSMSVQVSVLVSVQCPFLVRSRVRSVCNRH